MKPVVDPLTAVSRQSAIWTMHELLPRSGRCVARSRQFGRFWVLLYLIALMRISE